MNFKNHINNIVDFPQPGIIFRDIQPILENPDVFRCAIQSMGKLVIKPDLWVGIESRGFIFAAALAAQFGGGVKLIRKKGKLPPNNLNTVKYNLEYGSDSLQMEKGNDLKKVVIVDDVLATGGTIKAAETLCLKGNYEVTDKLVLIDIMISDISNEVKSLIQYG